VARVARATLSLEHFGRPREAARSFAAALRARPGGPLDAEARWGLARAYRALGQTAAEREALGILLRDHPASTYANLAHARLETLETP
jgi:thioredoxin-like negative regulator of GroEL